MFYSCLNSCIKFKLNRYFVYLDFAINFFTKVMTCQSCVIETHEETSIAHPYTLARVLDDYPRKDARALKNQGCVAFAG